MAFIQPTTPFLHFRMPIIRRLSILLVALIFAVILSVMVLWRVVTQPMNPFLDYGDLLPGQPKPAVERRAFNCLPPGANDYTQQYTTCTSRFLDGAFSQITLFIEQNRIVQSTFEVRENGLKFGDLMQSMDMLHLQPHPYEIFFFWNKLFVTVKT